MELQVIKNQRVITPNEDKWLYNANAKVISDKVYLGVNADSSEWTEITQEEKEALEKEWEKTNFTQATEQDCQDALSEMGVNLQ